MVGEINYSILDQNAPLKSAQAFNLGGGFNEGMSNALARQQAQQSQQMNALSLQKVQREMSDEQSVRNALAGSGGDFGAAADTMLKGGQYKQGMELKTKLAEQQKQKTLQAIEALKLEKAHSDAVVANPTQENAIAHIQQLAQETGKDFSGLIAQLQTMNPGQIRDFAFKHSLSAKELLPKIEKMDLGGTSNLMSVDPVTGKVVGQQVFNKTMSPEGKAADARAREYGTGAPVDFTPDAIDNAAYRYNMDGTLPPMGMGKAGVTVRTKILNRAAEIAAEEGIGGEDQRARHFTNKAIAGSIAQQEKQFGAMGSFVKNLDMQVDRVNDIAKEIKTFDSRLLNVPLRTFRGKIAGNPNQAKYDMYLTEIESEIGKLATGSTASVAELSASAQEKWAKIHDKNLSINDMLELLKETKEAGHLRVKGVEDNLKETRARLRKTKTPAQELPGEKQPTVSNW